MQTSEIPISHGAKKLLLVCHGYFTPDNVMEALDFLRLESPGGAITVLLDGDFLSAYAKDCVLKKMGISEVIFSTKETSRLGLAGEVRSRRFDAVVTVFDVNRPIVGIEGAKLLTVLSGAKEKRVLGLDAKTHQFISSPIRPTDFLAGIWNASPLAKVANFFHALALAIYMSAYVKISGPAPRRRADDKAHKGLEGKDVICFATLDWEEDLYQRPHHIMRHLSRKNRVLFVGSVVSFGSKRRHGVIYAKDAGRGENGIFLFRPVLLAKTPRGLFSEFNAFDKWLVRTQVRYAAKKMKMASPVVFLTTPRWAGIEDCLESSVFCYDCFDRFEAFAHMPPELTRRILDRTIRKADLVLASAGPLFDSCRLKNSNVHYVPNGVDAGYFSGKIAGRRPFPDIASIPGPVIGYHGAIAGWLDLDLVEYIARERSGYSVVLIGPVTRDVARLEDLKNVYILGKRDYNNLADYISHFDVGIIPFEINDITESVNPIKLYEYLAMGKPVVSVDLPEARNFSPHVRIARTYGEFVGHIDAGLLARDAESVKKAVEIASSNDWSLRGEKVAELIRKTAAECRVPYRYAEEIKR